MVPKLQGLVSSAKPCSPGRKVTHWLKGGEWDALLLDYYPHNSPHAAMVQPASETECLIPVAAGVRMRLSLTTNDL